jgi:hypothetical protein
MLAPAPAEHAAAPGGLDRRSADAQERHQHAATELSADDLQALLAYLETLK